jgi:2-iminobutanoate/2-iminopropanoate deaminase
MMERRVTPVDDDLFENLGHERSWSDAVSAGDLIWVCGQIGWDKKTGKFVEGGIGAQTEKALENLRLVLERSGSSLKSVITTHVYLTDASQYPVVDEIYSRFFPGDQPPARTTVVVKDLIDHGECLIDIEALALRE